MSIAIVNLQKKIPIPQPQIKRAVRIILKDKRIRRACLSVIFVSDQKIKALNKKFLRHDYATDVLTFDFSNKVSLDRKAANLADLNGEVIIAPAVAARQSKVYDTKVKEEIYLYLIHGILHLLGYDDHSSGEKESMQQEQNRLLNVLLKKVRR